MKIVFKKDYMLLTVFTKCSMYDVWQGWICFGFWFWIYQDFEYIWVLNMQGLKRVLNMPEYTWVNSEHASICLNMPKYAWMCLNLPNDSWVWARVIPSGIIILVYYLAKYVVAFCLFFSSAHTLSNLPIWWWQSNRISQD